MICPESVGKYFGALASIVGVLFLASVITISNFARVLQNINNNRQQQQGMGGVGAGAGMRQPPQPGLIGPQSVHQASFGATQGVGAFMQGQQHHMGGMGGMAGQLPPHRADDAHSSYHHITFADDLANTLGTIDVMVERDRKLQRVSAVVPYCRYRIFLLHSLRKTATSACAIDAAIPLFFLLFVSDEQRDEAETKTAPVYVGSQARTSSAL